VCYDLPQEMLTELHEPHALHTVSTEDFFSHFRAKKIWKSLPITTLGTTYMFFRALW